MDLFNAFLDLIFPPRCLVCGKAGSDPFCSNCRHQIQFIDKYCRICGKPMEKSRVCEDCRNCRPVFDIARSVAIYDTTIKEALHKFKFQNKMSLGDDLTGILIEYFKSGPDIDLSSVDSVTAVPLHQKRQRERGFNQSEFLAEKFARHYGLNFRNDILVKIKDTKPQFSLKRNVRFKNVSGAFEASPKDAIAGRRVLLVDDIFTTGATICECAKALKSAGAESVYVITLCRAVDD